MAAASIHEYAPSVGKESSPTGSRTFGTMILEKYATDPEYNPLTRKDILRIIDLADKYKLAKDTNAPTYEPMGSHNGRCYKLRLSGAWESWNKSAATELRRGLYTCFPRCYLDNYDDTRVWVYVQCEDFGVDWELIEFLKETRLPLAKSGEFD